MEKYEIVAARDNFAERINKIKEVIKPNELTSRIKMLEEKMVAPDFWSDQSSANKIIAETNKCKEQIKGYQELENILDEISMVLEFGDESLFDEASESIKRLEKKLASYETELLLNDEFDENNAILELHPGAGGTESMDWALMLYRMYKRYAERHNFKFELIDYEEGSEAGIKSVTFSIIGHFAYGMLKGEAGVHRLVRISPFDSASRRHTSFVGCSVVPEIDDSIEVEIDEKDLRVDTYHSSGAGGQHINKTDSAVRLTHIPTGIVVCSQSQRSQIQNREKAMQVLKARLYLREKELMDQKKKEISGEQMENGWGSQIRSYVLHPYSMVKDHRTSYESSQPNLILDGDLDAFLDNYLHWLKR